MNMPFCEIERIAGRSERYRMGGVPNFMCSVSSYAAWEVRMPNVRGREERSSVSGDGQATFCRQTHVCKRPLCRHQAHLLFNQDISSRRMMRRLRTLEGLNILGGFCCYDAHVTQYPTRHTKHKNIGARPGRWRLNVATRYQEKERRAKPRRTRSQSKANNRQTHQ